MKRHLIETFPAKEERSLFTLVENRTSYSFEMCELNLFETHQSVENVTLKFDHFVLTSMLTGKKVMKLPKRDPFDYFPGESVILPPGELMNIDFPEAKKGNPTQCLALTISDQLICDTIDKLNELHPKDPDWGAWKIDSDSFHLINNMELADTINRMVRITKSEHGKAKDIMVDLTLREMLIRLMQTQARVLFESSYSLLSNSNPLAASIEFIKANLTEKISLDRLAQKACMSRASFFKKFKEALGETPSQFIIKERLKVARQKLKQGKNINVTEVCFACGFENLSHFITSFKNEYGMTPKAYQLEAGQLPRA